MTQEQGVSLVLFYKKGPNSSCRHKEWDRGNVQRLRFRVPLYQLATPDGRRRVCVELFFFKDIIYLTQLLWPEMNEKWVEYFITRVRCSLLDSFRVRRWKRDTSWVDIQFLNWISLRTIRRVRLEVSRKDFLLRYLSNRRLDKGFLD